MTHRFSVKALGNGFNILSILLDAVERLLNDVERWDGQTLSTFDSTELSPFILFAATLFYLQQRF